MQIISVSATKLKQYISSILNDVSYGKKVAVIERHGKPVAKIIPIENEETNHTDFPDLKKKRKFKKGIWKNYNLIQVKTALQQTAGIFRNTDRKELLKDLAEQRRQESTGRLF